MDKAISTASKRAERPSRRRFLQLVGADLLGLVAAPLIIACDTALPHVVTIDDQTGFNPSSLTIPRGAMVRWKNTGTAPHTATADPAKAQKKSNAALPQGVDPWDSGPLYAGQTWTHTFDTPGQYVYFSSFDELQNVIGSITVNG